MALADCSSERCISFPFSETPATRSWLRKAWARLRVVTGLPKLSPHDLRHLFCSRLLQAGERPEVVRALMGHRSQKMTDYYSHVELEPKIEAVHRLEQAAMAKPPARERRMERRDEEDSAIARTARLIAIPARGRVQ